MTTRNLAAYGVDNELSRYLRDIRKFPMMTPEEESSLARRVRDDGDKAAEDRLINSHLRLVARIAGSYRGYGLPLADLISEGNLGLVQAVRRFDPERGFRLATYALWWIKAAIQDYILRSWSLVKVGTTAAQKKLFFNLRRTKRKLGFVDGSNMSDELVQQVADALHVSPAEVVSMDQRLSGRDHSLNTPVRMDEEGDEWQDRLEDETETVETNLGNRQEGRYRRNLLDNAMQMLNPRERTILAERRLKDSPTTLEDLSQQFGISRERVRQIETRAFSKVQQQVLALAA